MKQVKLWLEPLDDRLFLDGNRQKILDATKGQESEKKLITLLPTENLRKKFHENIESHVKATMKEKTLSREEMEQLLVRKLLELTNPNSEYDILLFLKVAKSLKISLFIDSPILFRKHQLYIILNLRQGRLKARMKNP